MKLKRHLLTNTLLNRCVLTLGSSYLCPRSRNSSCRRGGNKVFKAWLGSVVIFFHRTLSLLFNMSTIDNSCARYPYLYERLKNLSI